MYKYILNYIDRDVRNITGMYFASGTQMGVMLRIVRKLAVDFYATGRNADVPILHQSTVYTL